MVSFYEMCHITLLLELSLNFNLSARKDLTLAGALPLLSLTCAIALGIAHCMIYDIRSEKSFDLVIDEPGKQ